ncbi:MAG: hypothetical protein IJ069_13495 [Prevotella sp.]|nr:hypothetical protein [Prevotella sp.]
MELIIERIEKNDHFTVGRLSIETAEGKKHLCDTLEPKIKELDMTGRHIIKKRAAIPEGRYPVVITYCARQDRWLPLLLWVNKFKDVRILVGKTVKDITAGGIIIGEYHGDGRLVNSPNTMYDLKQRMVEAKENGEGVYIQVRPS